MTKNKAVPEACRRGLYFALLAVAYVHIARRAAAKST